MIYPLVVIASEAKQSRVPSAGSLDCFASLAMTAVNLENFNMSKNNGISITGSTLDELHQELLKRPGLMPLMMRLPLRQRRSS
jgi:hypothetical protein